MEFFADTEAVAQLEAELAQAQADERLPLPAALALQVALAWQLRQRDTVRSLMLADQVERQCGVGNLPPQVVQVLLLRLNLIRGEVAWLEGEFEGAQTLAQAALNGFAALAAAPGMALDAALGTADAHWLLAWLAYDQGGKVAAFAALAAMASASNGISMTRHTVAQACLARFEAFTDAATATARWSEHFASLAATEALHPAARCWLEGFYGIIANQNSDHVTNIRHLSQSWIQAMASGQIRRAITTAGNIGDAFNSLNDYHTALEWMQRGLLLAREKGWPTSLGNALQQSAETLRRLQQYDNAHALLREAQALMAAMTGSHSYALLLHYLGDVELALKQYPAALASFELLEQRTMALGQTDLQGRARRGQAQAQLELGKPKAALQAAEAALAGAQSNVDDQMAALRVLAEIHSRHPLPPPPAMQAQSAPLHYLHQALALAHGIEDYIIPGDLFDAIAHEHARLGDFAQAWQLAGQATLAREKTHGIETNNRARAMQAAYRSERAQAQDAHRRALESEAKRAEILQQSGEILAHLGAVGQEITAHLELDQVYAILNHHLHQLLDVNLFGIGMMDHEQQSLVSIFTVEDGRILPPFRLCLPEATRAFKRCVQEKLEFMVNRDAGTPDPGWPDFLIPTLSRMFFPLSLADQVLGVMTVQSRQPHAYGAREQLIFRTLCAYTAIALSNANAHRQLRENQQQMMLQDKMAGLGTLTAGVAHEINNPTNFLHVAAQNQCEDIAAFRQYLASMIEAEDAPEVVHTIDAHFAKLSSGVSTMLNGTRRIKAIVRDLRSFTRLDEAEKKAVRLSECITSTLNLVRTSWLEKVEFVTEFNDDPEVECWPALLNQVFMNLLVNGCQAIEEKQRQRNAPDTASMAQRGQMHLRLLQKKQFMTVEIRDDGIGIAPEVQARIMEPFFTTKEVGSGTGLGLSIAFGIVQKHGGTLNFSSTPGLGSCFRIELPLS
jgi:signal transduction histidine kinase